MVYAGMLSVLWDVHRNLLFPTAAAPEGMHFAGSKTGLVHLVHWNGVCIGYEHSHS